MSRVRWTEPRQEKLVEWMEQETVLDALDAVADGKVTIDAICSAGNRYFGYGRHVLKDGTTILKSNVAWHKTKRNKLTESTNAETDDEVVEEPDLSDGSPLWDEVLKDVEESSKLIIADDAAVGFNNSKVIESFLFRDIKERKLTEIITSLETLGQNKLAEDLRFCTS